MPRVGQAAKVPPPLAEELSGVVLSGETLAEHRACTKLRPGRAQGLHTYQLPGSLWPAACAPLRHKAGPSANSHASHAAQGSAHMHASAGPWLAAGQGGLA